MANISDKSGQANPVSIVTRKRSWSDLDLGLTLHPIKKDIVPLKDDAAIKSSIKNLILTNIYERPFQPFIAGNLRGLLFEPASSITVMELKSSISDVLNIYEPRINLLRIEIKDNVERNQWDITIHFQIKKFGITSSVGVLLKRLR